ncbi:MAG TPA: lysophospholipid acyltransferase family protein [Acidocella sp.]|nr:lysophospholipid acyltransferase family protein [Acidocella sp.]
MLAASWTLFAVPVQAFLLTRPGLGKERFARTYWRGVARTLGLRLRVIGELPAARPVLFVSNHSSWVDIVALGAVLPACFVAKGDVAGWQGIGTIARLGRTIFVSRARESVGREQRELAARLAAGDNIILFPEGTTSDGNHILPFASSFLTLAFGPAQPAVQPVTIVYDELDGRPAGPEGREEVAWHGDADLAPHFMKLGRRRSIRASIRLGTPIAPGAYQNRKTLTAVLEQEITTTAAALWEGRLES